MKNTTNGFTNPLRAVLFPLKWAWPSPWTLLGIAIGIAGLPWGTQGRWRAGVLEFHGGLVNWLLEQLPIAPMAMTLGHCVLGRTAAALDICRDHERVHVRQYERWGPLFVPAYLLASLAAWLAGGDAYRDNWFEREAFGGEAGIGD